MTILPELRAHGAEPSDAEIIWYHPGFCRFALPAEPGGAGLWQRTLGGTTVSIEPGTERDRQPGGPMLRRLLMHLCDLALRSGQSQVPLGDSPAVLAAAMNPPVAAADIRALETQVTALLSCRITVSTEGGPGLSVLDARGRPRATAAEWRPLLRLNARFLDNLARDKVALHRPAIAALQGSALALDLYAWLAAALPERGDEAVLAESWPELHARFAAPGQDAEAFQAAAAPAIAALRAALPNLDADDDAIGVGFSARSEPAPAAAPIAPPVAPKPVAPKPVAPKPVAAPAPPPPAPPPPAPPPPTRPAAPPPSPQATQAETPRQEPQREPLRADPVRVAPMRFEPQREPLRFEPDRPGPASIELPPVEASRPERPPFERPRPERPWQERRQGDPRPEQPRPEQPRVEQPRVDQPRPEQPRPDPRIEQPRPDPRFDPRQDDQRDPAPGQPMRQTISLRSHITGLQQVIWLQRANGRDNVIIEVTPGTRYDPAIATVLTLEPMVLQIAGGLHARDFERVSSWAAANRDLIDAFWDGEVDGFDEIISRVKKVPAQGLDRWRG